MGQRLSVPWAEMRYVPQFGEPSLLGATDRMGDTAHQILQYQAEQELKKRQIAATIHGEEEFHADIDLRCDFSEGMEFQMKDRRVLPPTSSHNWGELVGGRPDCGDTTVYSWEQCQKILRQKGHQETLGGECQTMTAEAHSGAAPISALVRLSTCLPAYLPV